DGIRGDLVTGVQTCALPIYEAPYLDDIDNNTILAPPERKRSRRRNWIIALPVVLILVLVAGSALLYMHNTSQPSVQYTQQSVNRSEERRVGKASRQVGSMYI